ncbi:unnamed protein product [Rotaria sordida]|uniref:UBC core domain-containing protein n=1 Tax=Rotaria sordida TaxID=392033 RepID=A0A814J7Z9_9BILA|nr:unnamed protein product [Rotaria sordida]CAF1034418.1 unnamed protein product [Rotaria sordida]
MTHWIGYIDGPEETPFAGGRFHLNINFPAEFPFKPPHIRFITSIYHPNISIEADPNVEHGLNRDALKLCQTDKQKYEDIAIEWTRKHADNRQSLKW